MNKTPCSYQAFLTCDYLLIILTALGVITFWLFQQRYRNNADLLNNYNKKLDEQITAVKNVFHLACSYYGDQIPANNDVLTTSTIKRDLHSLNSEIRNLEKIYSFFNFSDIAPSIKAFKICVTGGTFETTNHYQPHKVAELERHYAVLYAALNTRKRNFNVFDIIIFFKKN